MKIPRPTHTSNATWQFVRHYLEMVVAMLLGMTILGPLESMLLDPVGWQSVRAVPELNALVMATNMTLAMVAWMRYRGHGGAATTLMAAAMYLSFVVLFPLLWLGVVSPSGVLVGGHLAMLPAMAAAMLLRRDEYTGHHLNKMVVRRRSSPTAVRSEAGKEAWR
jgi:hypothetical protein